MTKKENLLFINDCKDLNIEKIIQLKALEALKERLISRFDKIWDKVLDSPEFFDKYPILKNKL